MLIIVTGLPATGKTTIARSISARIRAPLFSKDEYKETLFDSLGTKDREWSRSIGRAAIDLMYSDVASCMRVGLTCVVESNFKPEFDNERMGKLLDEYRVSSVQVLCKADGSVVYDRFSQRASSGDRHPGHNDAGSLDELRPVLMRGRAEPLAVPGPLIEIDTTDFGSVDVDALVRELSAQLVL